MSDRDKLLRRARLAQAKAALKLRKQEAAEEAYVPIPGAVPTREELPPTPLPAETLPGAIGRRADDVARAVASGMTFGFADELAALGQAATTDQPYAEALEAERARDVEIPPAIRVGGELGGALTTGAGAAARGLSFLANAPRTLPSLMGRGAAEGAAYGGLFGAGTGEGTEGRIGGALRGAATGAATGAGLGAISRGLLKNPARPTVETLKQQADDAYTRADAAGVIVKQDRLKNALPAMRENLAEAGFDKTLHPKVMAAFNRLEEGAEANQTLKGMEILRRVIKGAAKSNEADERAKAMILLDDFDEFIEGLGQADLLSGTPAAVSALKEGRSLWHTSKKAETIDALVERAGNRAGQFTGSGYENALRTEFRGLVQNPKRLRGFTDTEQEFMRRVARGTPLGNAMRWLGKMAPRGVVSTALSGGMGGAALGPIGAVGVPMAGEAGRAAATTMTGGNVQRVMDEILKRQIGNLPTTVSPLQQRLLTSGILTGIEGERAAPVLPVTSTSRTR